MPNLPRIPRTVRRRHRAPQRPVERSEPRIAEIEAAGLRWLQLEEPTAVETAWLAQNFEFHELDLEDVLSTRQRPKIDEYDDYMFIVLHVPHYNKERARLDAAELNVFIGHDYIVTLPNVPLKPLGRLFAQLEDNQERREEYFGKGSGYVLYEILSELFDYCFPILDKIGFKLDRMREAIFTERRSEDVVRDISDVKHEIVSYRKVIKPERSTLRLLERTRYLPDDLEVYFDDIVDKAERIWDQLDNYKEVVEALEQTNESVIAHKQNDILRLLTIFSVILLPLTLLSGIFGMNFQPHPVLQQLPRLHRDGDADGDHRRGDARVLPRQALDMTERLWAPWRMEYIQGGADAPGCIFCDKAAAGDDEANLIVHRGERAYVLMNLYPYSNGHLMVAPYRHVAAPGDLDEGERAEMWALLDRSLDVLTDVMAPHGFNAGINIGRVAGAGVEDHIHLHVVPRWNGDTNFMPVLADVKVMPEHLTRTAAKLRDAWRDRPA